MLRRADYRLPPAVCAALLVVGLMAGGASGQTFWGSMTVNSGPDLYDWQAAQWVDEYFEDGSRGNGSVSSNILMYQTQCFGGAFLDNFNAATGEAIGDADTDTVAFTNTTAYSANGPNVESVYYGYHRGAAIALQPGADSGDVHLAGFNTKDDSELPMQSGTDKTVGGNSSTHVLIWGGNPLVPDYMDMAYIQMAFPTSSTVKVRTLAGNGTSPFSNVTINGAATKANFEAELQTIGQAMNADEQFILFVTDHGNKETGTAPAAVAPNTVGTAVVQTPNDVLKSLFRSSDNQPKVMLTAPQGNTIDTQLVMLELASSSPHTVDLSDPSVVGGTLTMPDGTVLETWTMDWPESSFNYVESPFYTSTAQPFKIHNYSSDPVDFTHLIVGTGDIAKLPEPVTVSLVALGAVGLALRRRR